MGRNRMRNGENGLPERENPYMEFEPAEDEDDFAEDYDEAYDDDDADDVYDDDAQYGGVSDREYTDEADDYAYSSHRSHSSRSGAMSFDMGSLEDFVGTVQGKILIAAIALLLVILIGLVVWQLTSGSAPSDGGQNLPSAVSTDSAVFGGNGNAWSDLDNWGANSVFSDDGDEPFGFDNDYDGNNDDLSSVYDEMTAPPSLVFSSTGAGTGAQQPEETQLPIILSNTPTPVPSPTPTASPTASPEPTASPTPSPSPVVDIGTGKTNREARLRASMSANGSVKSTIKKGERVTIHEAVVDSDGHLWYAVTVDDINTDGWMRDYVLNLDGELSAPVSADADAQGETSGDDEQTVQPTAAANVLGTGKTNREANVRRAMNGKVLVQLRKGRAVDILEVLQDKKGDTWYQIRTQSGNTKGFVRDYVITLDAGVNLSGASAADAQAEPTAEAEPAQETEAQPEAEPQTEAAAQPEATLTPEQALLEREVIAHAKTNREANIRVVPDGKVARQLSKGVELLVLDAYTYKGNVWYEVCTTTGRTHGYVRDYVISVTGLDKDYQTKEYTAQ